MFLEETTRFMYIIKGLSWQC